MLFSIMKRGRHPIFNKKLTKAQKAADWLSYWAGSWTFIIILLSFMAGWMLINYKFIKWDPYPFILLNFILSALATMQAPIILMSQNRAAERDRAFAKYDHGINTKAEHEIKDMQKDLEIIKDMIRKIK